MKLLKKLLWVIILPLSVPALSQPRLDNTVQLVDTDAQPVAHEPLREADIAFQWTVERVIDTREKQNLALNWPQNPLINLMVKSALEANLPAYTTSECAEHYSDSELVARGSYCHVIQVPCWDDPDELCDSFICEPLDLSKVVKWRVIEEWVFDKEQGRMIPRIVSIAPLFRPVVAGLELEAIPLFWIKYDEARNILAQNKVFEGHNEAGMVSYDHFFQARLFSSYITKYPNAFDLQIGQMEEFAENNMAALYEAERIKQKLFETEHDQWEY